MFDEHKIEEKMYYFFKLSSSKEVTMLLNYKATSRYAKIWDFFIF